jgi:hypothetical protein
MGCGSISPRWAIAITRISRTVFFVETRQSYVVLSCSSFPLFQFPGSKSPTRMAAATGPAAISEPGAKRLVLVGRGGRSFGEYCEKRATVMQVIGAGAAGEREAIGWGCYDIAMQPRILDTRRELQYQYRQCAIQASTAFQR